MEALIDKGLKDNWLVGKPIEHNKVFIVPPSGQESSFPLISFSDADQVIGTSKVKLGANSGLVQLFQGRGD